MADGALLVLCAVPCFQGYDGGRIFFMQNIVNSGLTGELLVGIVRQMIDQQRFYLTSILQPPNMVPRVSPFLTLT